MTIGVSEAIKGFFARRGNRDDHAAALERQQQLNKLFETLIIASSLEEKLQLITDGIVKIFAADFCRIWMLKQGDLCDSCMHREVAAYQHACKKNDLCLHLMASSGRYTHIDGQVHRRVPVGCYKIGLIAGGSERKFLTNNVPNDSRVHNREWAKEIGLVAFAGYRILSPEGKVCGVLALFSKQPITPEEDAALENIASLTGQIIILTQAERALNTSEEQNRLILENTLDAVVSINSEGVITGWNRQAEKIFGWPAGEALGLTLSETIIPPRHRDAHQMGLKRFLDTGKGAVFNKHLELTALHHDGHEFPIEMSVTKPVQTEGTFFFSAFIHDITERKQAEEELELHDRLLQSLLDLQKMSQAPEGQIWDFLNLEIRQITHSELVFIGLFNAGENVFIAQTWHKDVMTSCHVDEKSLIFPLDKAGIWAEAIRKREPIIINDYRKPHPAKKNYPSGHVPLTRILSVPLFDGDNIPLLACVANKETPYSESDVRTITTLLRETWKILQSRSTPSVCPICK